MIFQEFSFVEVSTEPSFMTKKSYGMTFWSCGFSAAYRILQTTVFHRRHRFRCLTQGILRLPSRALHLQMEQHVLPSGFCYFRLDRHHFPFVEPHLSTGEVRCCLSNVAFDRTACTFCLRNHIPRQSNVPARLGDVTFVLTVFIFHFRSCES